jgi:hypothetical protein
MTCRVCIRRSTRRPRSAQLSEFAEDQVVTAIGGIVVTVIGAVIVYLLIGDNGLLNKKEPVTLGREMNA